MNEIKGKIKELENEILKWNNTKNNIIDKNKGFMINIIFPFLMLLLMAAMMDLILIINSFSSASSVVFINTYFGIFSVCDFLVVVISSICISFGSVLSFVNYLDYKKDLKKINEIDDLIFRLNNDLMNTKNELVEKNLKNNKIKKNYNMGFSNVKYFNENLVRGRVLKNNRRILVKKRSLV